RVRVRGRDAVEVVREVGDHALQADEQGEEEQERRGDDRAQDAVRGLRSGVLGLGPRGAGPFAARSMNRKMGRTSANTPEAASRIAVGPQAPTKCFTAHAPASEPSGAA